MGIGRQKEVDDAGTGDLGSGHQVRGRHGSDQLSRQIPGLTPGGLGHDQGQIGGEVAMGGIAGALHQEIGRGGAADLAGLDQGAPCSREKFLDLLLHSAWLYGWDGEPGPAGLARTGAPKKFRPIKNSRNRAERVSVPCPTSCIKAHALTQDGTDVFGTLAEERHRGVETAKSRSVELLWIDIQGPAPASRAAEGIEQRHPAGEKALQIAPGLSLDQELRPEAPSTALHRRRDRTKEADATPLSPLSTFGPLDT